MLEGFRTSKGADAKAPKALSKPRPIPAASKTERDPLINKTINKTPYFTLIISLWVLEETAECFLLM